MRGWAGPVTEILFFATNISVTGRKIFPYEHSSPVTGTNFLNKITSLSQHIGQSGIILWCKKYTNHFEPFCWVLARFSNFNRCKGLFMAGSRFPRSRLATLFFVKISMCSYEGPGWPSYRDLDRDLELGNRDENSPIWTLQPGDRDENFRQNSFAFTR